MVAPFAVYRWGGTKHKFNGFERIVVVTDGCGCLLVYLRDSEPTVSTGSGQPIATLTSAASLQILV